MRVIGLTGSIACGKSTISRYLLSLGFPVVDGDQISRELTAPGSPVLGEIRHNFGERYINENGNLNRRALGALIFQDEHARSRLDAVMAPHLKRATNEKIEQHRNEGAALCFLDMPLLFEKGYDRLCESVWTVWLPEDIQLSRLMARDHLSVEDALKRIRSVMSSDEKASRASFVIDNSGPVLHTLSVVDRLLQYELNPSFSPDPAGYAPVYRRRSSPPSSVSPEAQAAERAPEVMERPAAAKRQASRRKTEWQAPLWIRITLVASSAVLAVSIISFFIMRGYLDRQMKEREDNQLEILDHYFVKINTDYNHYVYRFSEEYKDLILTYAAEYNLDPAFVAAVIMNESTFRAEVESPVGARGLMQLMPDTAEWIAGKLKIQGYSFEMMKKPEVNIRFGCWYLNYLCGLYDGDLNCVISAYHAGPGTVNIWLMNPSVSDDSKTFRLDRLPEGETKTYAERVTRDYGIYKILWNTDDSSGSIADSTGGAVVRSRPV